MAYVLLLGNFGKKKICSKQVVEYDCKLPSLLSLILSRVLGNVHRTTLQPIQESSRNWGPRGTKVVTNCLLSLKSFFWKHSLWIQELSLPALLSSLKVFPQDASGVCVCGTALLRGQAWQRGVAGCAAQGRAFRECQPSFGAGHSCTCWRKGSPSPSELSILCRVSAASAAFPPQPRAWSQLHKLPHSQAAVSPSAAGLCCWGNGLFPAVHHYLGAHIILCAGSWVLKPLTPRWLPVLLNSVLMQPLPLQPFWTSVSSSRSLLVLMFCVFAISSFVPLLWLSFPI